MGRLYHFGIPGSIGGSPVLSRSWVKDSGKLAGVAWGDNLLWRGLELLMKGDLKKRSQLPPLFELQTDALRLRCLIRDEISSQTARGNRSCRRAYLAISNADGPEAEARPLALLVASPIVGIRLGRLTFAARRLDGPTHSNTPRYCIASRRLDFKTAERARAHPPPSQEDQFAGLPKSKAKNSARRIRARRPVRQRSELAFQANRRSRCDAWTLATESALRNPASESARRGGSACSG